MNKNIIRLTESELKRVITESVNKILRENIGRSNEVSALYEELKETLGCDLLCDEIAGKIEERMLFDILSSIKGMYIINDEE